MVLVEVVPVVPVVPPVLLVSVELTVVPLVPVVSVEVMVVVVLDVSELIVPVVPVDAVSVEIVVLDVVDVSVVTPVSVVFVLFSCLQAKPKMAMAATVRKTRIVFFMRGFLSDDSFSIRMTGMFVCRGCLPHLLAHDFGNQNHAREHERVRSQDFGVFG